MLAREILSKIVRSVGLSKVTVRVYSHSCPLDMWKPEQVKAGSVNADSGPLQRVYEESQAVFFTKQGATFNHHVDDKLVRLLKDFGPIPKLKPTFGQEVVPGQAPNCPGYNKAEQRDELKQNICQAVSTGVRDLQHENAPNVEGFEDAETSAEAAFPPTWENQNLRAPTQREVVIPDVLTRCSFLMEKMPDNLPTLRGFTNDVQTLCKTLANVTLRGSKWLKERWFIYERFSGQHPALSVTPGDVIPSVVLIVKGLTFNSGGLCIVKSCKEMKHMSGAAAAFGGQAAREVLSLYGFQCQSCVSTLCSKAQVHVVALASLGKSSLMASS